MRWDDETIAVSAQTAISAFRFCLLDQLHDAIGLVFVDERPDKSVRLRWVADLQRPGAFHEFVRELIKDTVIDDDAIDRHADLSGMHELAPNCGVDSCVDICVVQNDNRSIAAKLQLKRLQDGRVRHCFSNAPANWRRARKGNETRYLMLDQRCTNMRATAGKDTDEAFRKPSFFQQFGKDCPAGDN